MQAVTGGRQAHPMRIGIGYELRLKQNGVSQKFVTVEGYNEESIKDN